MSVPKVSIVVTAHNYAEYLETCLDSALDQTYDNYEIIVVDDGSTDETPQILREYTYDHPDTFRVIRLEGKGLPIAANIGIDAADGEYVIRLDADDYFDENILTVLSSYLSSHSEIELVYPDYYMVNDEGNILEHVRLPEVGEEVKLLNRSPLAAGAMYRKRAWEQIGGYNEDLPYQEDFDFWIRFTNEFSVKNVNLPLMYYRQHDGSMSTNLSGRLSARRSVKREFVEQNIDKKSQNQDILAIIPAREEHRITIPDGFSDPLGDKPLALCEISGQPLIKYTIDAALNSRNVNRVVVSTESEQIAEVARTVGAEVPTLRSTHLSRPEAQLPQVVQELLYHFESEEDYVPDLIATLPYVSPLRTSAHVDEAIDTYSIFSVDSVIGVERNQKFLWQPGKFGLEPLFEERLLREEREGLFQENGSIYVTEPSLIRNQDEIIGQHIGHILMQRHTSIHIDSWIDLQMLETILKKKEITDKSLTALEEDDD